ncbi:hypothetical protein [Streptomyces sp. NPDC054961]
MTATPRGPSTGVAEARRALGEGTAVVLPNPAPLTYVLAATVPGAVNTAKGRPAGQAVALWAHHPDTLTALDASSALDACHARTARRLLEEELLTLLVPLRQDVPCPGWLSPAVRDGWALLFGARWTPLLPVLAGCPLLYVSSANRTGRPPAATASDATAMFPPPVPVLTSDTLTGRHEEDGAPRRATTTVRIHPDGRLELHRHGAQDHPYPTAAAYLHHLTAYQP